MRQLLTDDNASADGRAPGWRNFWRDSDPVGAGPLHDDPMATFHHEEYLPDPPLPWRQRGDNAPPIRAHAETGYRTQGAFAEHLRTELERLRRHLHSAAHAQNIPPERDDTPIP